MMKKVLCLAALTAMLMCMAAGCAGAPANTIDDSGVPATPTRPTDLTVSEDDLFNALDGVSKLSLGMKDTDQSAMRCAVALLDWCEQTDISEEELQTAVLKYYGTFGSEFKIMFAEKMRLTALACESLRDPATRAETMAPSGASSTLEWTDKAFDTAAFIAAVDAQ